MPSTYYGDSEQHIHYNNHILKPGEAIRLFGKQDITENTIWLDMKQCSGTVDHKTFSFLTNIAYISLEKCDIQDCTRAFASVDTLSMLQFRKCTFPLESKTFEDNKGITTLFIQNFATEITPCFNHLNNLKVLCLEKCKIPIVNGNLFSGLVLLEILSLTSCKIDAIESDAFNNLTKLDGLNIRDSQINAIDSNVFTSLTNVKFFSFHHNEVDFSLNCSIMEQMKSLHTIQLDTEILKSLEYDNFAHLERVVIGYNEALVDPNLDEIICKLNAKNISREYVLCDNVDLDSDEN